MSGYPSVIASFPTHVDGQVIFAADINNIQTEVVAIETFVGTIGSIAGTLENDIRNPLSNGGGHVQQANVGGTGQTSYNKGDLLVASSSSVLSKVNVGGDGTVLTADSTQTSGVSYKTNTGATSFQNLFKAASSIVGGTGILPVYITPFQSDGGIQIDNSAVFSSILGANQTNSVLSSFNVGSNANRTLLILMGAYQGGGQSVAVTSVLYGSSVMTQIDSTGQSQFHLSSWYMNNPPTGNHSVLGTYVASNGIPHIGVFGYSYYNTLQNSSVINAHTVETNSLTANVITVANGALVVGMGDATSFLSGLPNNQNLNNNNFSAGASAQLFPPQTNSFTATGNQSASGANLAVALTPITVPDFQIALASATSSVQSATFIGFSTSSIASGQTGMVTVEGIVTGLSSLVSGSPYYLGNTTGTIQATPGTITRKVGMPISSVALLLNNS